MWLDSMFASKGGWIPKLSDMQKCNDKIRQDHASAEVQHSLIIGVFSLCMSTVDFPVDMATKKSFIFAKSLKCKL